MEHQTANRFDTAISTLCAPLAELLREAPPSVKQSAFEVRLRVGMPISITCAGQIWFLDNHAQLHNRPGLGFPYVTQEQIAESVVSMCAYSVHSHQEEMKHGFISLRGGHRAGISGTAVLRGNEITAIRDITSINLRIARDLEGVATPLLEQAFGRGGIVGLLLVGPPSSGKTTVLRDLARQVSSGRTGKYRKTVVIDERCEIGAVFDGIPQNHLGPCTDILSGYPKAQGIQHAVRTLSPQIIICDEIGGGAETEGILEGLNCGVTVIATAHAGSLAELAARPQLMRLLECGAFAKIARLEGSDTPGIVAEIIETRDFLETDRYGADYSKRGGDRLLDGIGIIAPSYDDPATDPDAWNRLG